MPLGASPTFNTMELEYKPDFAQSAARYEAWWHGELLDRAPVNLYVRSDKPWNGPQKTHASLRERWLDVEFVVQCAAANMERGVWMGDTLPVFMPNIGPEITATLFGCELDFSEHSSWSEPIIHDADEWPRLLEMAPDFENIYWQTMEAMTDLSLEIGRDKWLTGLTDLHGNWDILAALRDPQELCMDVLDCPEIVTQVALHAADSYVQSFERLWAKIGATGQGATTWLPFYHNGPAYVPSCDFWCMVSGEAARDMVLPSIVREMAPLERSIFHLDGPQALRHLDLLLELPHLNAVQWVYGAGAGPAAKWIDVYKRIQSAGKSFQLLAETPADALEVLAAIGPRGAWVCVGEAFASPEEATAFLREVEKL
jgi:hypothetical protein